MKDEARGATEKDTLKRGTAQELEPWLRCAICHARIARPRDRIVVSGGNTHTFMNPAGIRFSVACFAEAPGCCSEGERSTVWTWFPGYAWQIELCRSCHTHLGWSFHAATSFYGLIASQLVESLAED